MTPARPMGFPEAVVTVLWRDWLRTGRRASRSEFWFGFAACCALAVAWFFALGALVPAQPPTLLDPDWMLRHPLPAFLNLVFAVWINVGMFTASVRRLRDAGRPVPWLLVGWPPYVALLLVDWGALAALALVLWWLAGSLALVVLLAAAPSPRGGRQEPAWHSGSRGHAAPPFPGDAEFGEVPAAARVMEPPVERVRHAARRAAPRRRAPVAPAVLPRDAGGGGLERELHAARERKFRGALVTAGGVAVVAALCAVAYGLGLRLGGELPRAEREERPAAVAVDPDALVADAEAAAAAGDWARAMGTFGEAAALGSTRGAAGARIAGEVLAGHQRILDALENGTATAAALRDGMAAAALSPDAAKDLRRLRDVLGEDAWRNLTGAGP